MTSVQVFVYENGVLHGHVYCTDILIKWLLIQYIPVYSGWDPFKLCSLNT